MAFGLASPAWAQDLRTATLVGSVTDSSGAAIADAAVTVTNVDTNVVTRGKTNGEGAYYIPFLNIGNYRLNIEATGFKKFAQTGLTFNAGETPRIDVKLEIGSLTEEISITAQAPLLDTDTAIVGGIATAKDIHDEPIPQSKPQHFMYYIQGAQANNDGSYHILGQPETQMSYTLDGVTAKQALGKALGDTNTLITPPVDTLQEAQVFTTGIPAEIGHAAGGAYSLTTKSGTNELHFSAEERYINKAWLHRQAFNQGATNTPFEYHNFNATLSGPIWLPKIYNGRNRTFFLLGYRLDYDHEQNFATVSVPTQDELNGDFSFAGLGQPIYDPRSITCSKASCADGTGYVATRFTGNLIPQSMFDPVARKFFAQNPYNLPNLPSTFTTTGPTNNYISGNHYISDRQAYLGKIDQTISDKQKIFVRYIWNKYRVIGSRENILFNWTAIDNTALAFGRPEPIDERNIALGYVFTMSPSLINQFQLGYQRRNDNIYPVTANQGWAAILGIPGVGPETFPGFVSMNGTSTTGGTSFNWTANPGGGSRTLNEGITISDNVTKVRGLHTFKFGYQGILQRENDIAAVQPSGVYTFNSTLTGNPLTPNTGNSLATFELGAVSSATFTTLLSNYLPHWNLHQFFAQDDWRIRKDLTLSLGVRYSYETSADTQYGRKSQFDPAAIDPVTGLRGAIVHPTGQLYSPAKDNITPRIGLSWNFHPKFVFRGSFGMFTQDLVQQLGQEDYTATAVVAQPSGNPYPAFYLSDGPGPIKYNLGTNGTGQFVGTNYSSRNATFFDTHLRNPYTMSWAGGFQWEFKPSYVAEITYQGAAGVHLTGSVNINNLPLSIYQSTDTTLLNQVFANSQSYLPYTQFGAVNYLTNAGHSTYHALLGRLQHRFSSGFSANFLFTYSKNLTGNAVSGYNYYDWSQAKALASSDQKFQFVNQVNYDLPFGRGRRFFNQNAFVDQVIGGWTILTIQSIRSGLPVNFTSSGSPNRYLPGEGGLNIVPGQQIRVDNWDIGPNRFPQSAQNPFFNINAFTYAPAFTQGNAGINIARNGWMWWPQYSITKTWAYKEKYKLSVRMDATNLFPQRVWYSNPNSVVNLTSPQNFGKFPATTGYSFSNFFTPNGTLQGMLRLAF